MLDREILETVKATMRTRFPEMVQYYLEDGEMFINRMNESVSKSDIGDIIAVAHTFKSASRQMGAVEVSEIAEKIEEEAQNIAKLGGDINDLVVEYLANITQAFNLAKAEYEEIIK